MTSKFYDTIAKRGVISEYATDVQRWYGNGDLTLTVDTYKPTWNEEYGEYMKKSVTVKDGEVGYYYPTTGEVKIEKNIQGDEKVSCSRKTVHEYELKVVNLAAGVEKRMLLDVSGWVELADGRCLHDVVLVKHAKELSAFSRDAEHLSVKVKLIDTHTVECKEKE
jgi:hypothetical protein